MSALSGSDFRRLWLAGLISDTGDWLLLVSLPIVIFAVTGSVLGTAGAFLVELAPPVLLAPLAGRLADRPDRRRTLIAVSLAQAGVLVPLLFVHGRAGLPIVYAVIALQSALGAMFDPTKAAFLPTLVRGDRILSANSLIALNENVGRLVGASLGGLLLAAGGGLRTIAAADAVSFLAAVVLLAGIAPAPSAATTDCSTVGSWRAALAERTVRAGLAVVFVASIAQGLFVALFIVFVARTLHGGPGEIGLLRGVQAVGSIAAGLLLASLRRVASGWLAAWAAFAFGLLCLAIWNAPHLSTAEPLYVALFIAVGAPGIGLVSGLTSAVQQATTDGERGRAFAALAVAESLGQALGLVAAGLLAGTVGVIVLLDGQGALYLLAGLLAILGLSVTVWGQGPQPRKRDSSR